MTYTIDNYLAISPRLVLLYLLCYTILLPMGYFLHNYVIIVPLILFSYFLIKGNIGNTVIFIIFWTYLYNYYIGQQNITNQILITYFLKDNLYVILAILFLFKRINMHNVIVKKFVKWAICILFVVILSNVTNGKFTVNIVAFPSNIYTFILILCVPISLTFNNKLFNLVIAIAFLQLLMSVLQVTDTIPRPILSFNPQYQQTIFSVPGLDDVASGTMGAYNSNITSWICTIVFCFLFAVANQRKSIKITVISFLFILQYGTVDSKIALGITILGIFIIVIKNLLTRRITLKTISISILTIFMSFILYIAITHYYKEYIQIDKSGIPTAKAENSMITIVSNFTDWGKIAGFRYLTEEYASMNITRLLFGYGQDNFKADHLVYRDAPIMQTDNSLRSVSTFLSVYGQFGLLGLGVCVGFLLAIRSSIKSSRYITELGKNFRNSGVIIVDMTILFMFLGPTAITLFDSSFLMILVLYAIVIRNEQFASKFRNNTLC